jgi:hypothetical protein
LRSETNDRLYSQSRSDCETDQRAVL